MSERHKFRAVADFLAVPEDKLGACLKDFGLWLTVMREAREAFGADSPLKPMTEEFEWIDDGKNDLHFHIIATEPRA